MRLHVGCTRASVRRSRALCGGTRRKADLKMESGKVKVIMKSESTRASVRRLQALGEIDYVEARGEKQKQKWKMGNGLRFGSAFQRFLAKEKMEIR